MARTRKASAVEFCVHGGSAAKRPMFTVCGFRNKREAAKFAREVRREGQPARVQKVL